MDRGVCFNQLNFLKEKKLNADVNGWGVKTVTVQSSKASPHQDRRAFLCVMDLRSECFRLNSF